MLAADPFRVYSGSIESFVHVRDLTEFVGSSGETDIKFAHLTHRVFLSCCVVCPDYILTIGIVKP